METENPSQHSQCKWKIFTCGPRRFWTFLCLLAIVSRGSAKSPTYQWPLTHLSMAWEVDKEIDAVQPTVETCHKLGLGPPYLGMNAFLFDHSPGEEVIINFLHTTSIRSTWSMTIDLSPDDLNGVILEYVAASSETDEETVVGFTLQLVSGRPRLNLYNYQNQNLAQVTSTEVLPLNSWTSLWFGLKGDIQLDLMVDSALAGQFVTEDDDDELRMMLHGSFYVSASMRNPALGTYKGRLCCMSVYHDTSVQKLKATEVKDECLYSKWPHTPPGTIATDCPVTADPQVIALFPLTNRSRGYDVITGTPPIGPEDYECTRIEATTPLPTPSSHLYLDGCVFSYLTLNLDDNVTNGDFVVAIMVRPEPPTEGVVWEYKADDGKPDGITKMMLTLRPNEASLEFFNRTGLCASVTAVVSLPSDQWSLVYMTFQQDTQGVFISADGVLVGTTGQCGGGTPASTNGTLTVGKGSSPDHFGYHGVVACLLVTRKDLNRLHIHDELMDVCQNHDYDVGLTCGSTSLATLRKFKSMSRDHAPTAGHVTSRTVRSLVECSSRCLSSADCKAFTYKKSVPQDQCKMFDHVTKYGLTQDSGNHYYMVNNAD